MVPGLEQVGIVAVAQLIQCRDRGLGGGDRLQFIQQRGPHGRRHIAQGRETRFGIARSGNHRVQVAEEIRITKRQSIGADPAHGDPTHGHLVGVEAVMPGHVGPDLEGVCLGHLEIKPVGSTTGWRDHQVAEAAFAKLAGMPGIEVLIVVRGEGVEHQRQPETGIGFGSLRDIQGVGL